MLSFLFNHSPFLEFAFVCLVLLFAVIATSPPGSPDKANSDGQAATPAAQLSLATPAELARHHARAEAIETLGRHSSDIFNLLQTSGDVIDRITTSRDALCHSWVRIAPEDDARQASAALTFFVLGFITKFRSSIRVCGALVTAIQRDMVRIHNGLPRSAVTELLETGQLDPQHVRELDTTAGTAKMLADIEMAARGDIKAEVAAQCMKTISRYSDFITLGTAPFFPPVAIIVKLFGTASLFGSWIARAVHRKSKPSKGDIAVAKQNHGQVAKALGEAEQIARKLRQIATILLADFERRSDDEYLLYEQPLRLEMEELRKCEKFAETMIEKLHQTQHKINATLT